MKYIATTIIMCSLLCACSKDAARKTMLDTSVCPLKMIEYDDGDSFACMDEQIRVLGIDTPEIIHTDHGIFIDQPMGRKAAAFTEDLLKGAGRIVIVRGGSDPYGRTLAHVLIDGELLGAKLIKAGLAYENISRYGDGGLPEYALQITEAWNSSLKPSFEDPHVWREKHQKRP